MNVIANAPHVPVEEEGAIVATPVVSPDLRAALIALGLLIWLGYAGYKLTRPPAVDVTDTQGTPVAD